MYLQQAVQSVMGGADSPTLQAQATLPTGDAESFSSGFLSDPVPWRSEANVIDSVMNFDPGSASGEGPGTSSGAGLSSRGHDKRMLHFNVEYRNRNVDVFMADTETVGKFSRDLYIQKYFLFKLARDLYIHSFSCLS